MNVLQYQVKTAPKGIIRPSPLNRQSRKPKSGALLRQPQLDRETRSSNRAPRLQRAPDLASRPPMDKYMQKTYIIQIQSLNRHLSIRCRGFSYSNHLPPLSYKSTTILAPICQAFLPNAPVNSRSLLPPKYRTKTVNGSTPGKSKVPWIVGE
jgi:hypothetical protein